MVNENRRSIKANSQSQIHAGRDERDRVLLELLGHERLSVSGQMMADTLGISRVALFKRIERLRGNGYRIESDRHGYKLAGDDAVLAPEFGTEAPVHWFRELPSTMDEAWRLASENCPTGTLVIADSQSAGRGQRDRAWVSPEGGLYLTIVLRPMLPASMLGGLILESAAIMLDIIESTFGLSLELRWPNDLVTGNQKIGGILAEWAGDAGFSRFVTLGLGLNLHAVQLEGRATAGVADLARAEIRRRELAGPFRRAVLAWSSGSKPTRRPWGRYQYNGLKLCVRDWDGLEVIGTAIGFSERGGLLLDLNGGVKEFLIGETSLVQPLE